MTQNILMLNRSTYIDSGLPDYFNIDKTPCIDLYSSDAQVPKPIENTLGISKAELVFHRDIKGFPDISSNKLPQINYISSSDTNTRQTMYLMNYAPVPSSVYKMQPSYWSGSDIGTHDFNVDVSNLFNYEEYDNKYIYVIITKNDGFKNNYAVSELVKVTEQDASSQSIHSIKLASVQNIWEPLHGTHNILETSTYFSLSNYDCWTNIHLQNAELQKIFDDDLSSAWTAYSWIGIPDPNDYPYKGIFGG